MKRTAPNIHVSIDERFRAQIRTDQLEKAAQATLQTSLPENSLSLSIVITDDRELQRLNLQFRQIDAPTDVLSFPQNEPDPDSGQLYLGDVIISFERTLAQAGHGGHSPAEELQLLVVHGILHLLGHDHDTPENKARMWSRQTEILAEIGCSLRPN